MERLIAGAQRELRSTAPAKTRAALKAFRVRLRARRITGGQKKFENELEAFLQNDPLLRAATERHLGQQVKLACERVVAVLKRMEPALAKVRARPKVGTKLAPARKTSRRARSKST